MKRKTETKMTIVKGGRINKKKSVVKQKQQEEADQLSVQIVKSFQQEALPLSKKISSLKIESEHDFVLAAELLEKLKSKAKAAIKERQSMTGPLKTVIKRIEQHFKPFLNSIALIEKDTKQKMLEYRQEVQSSIKKVNRKFESGDLGHRGYLNKVEKLESKLTVESSAVIRNIKVLEIYNENIIPREYLVPNKQLIEEELKSGIKIPGCKLVTKENIAI